MLPFVIGIIILVVGYFVYGKYVENHFEIDPEKTTPAIRLEDGIDYSPMSLPRVFLIQLLNIAGLGPIFGAIQGAVFGPVAFVWIALGSVFAGAVHDYFSGMISLRNDGASLAEIVGKYLGEGVRKVMRVFSVVLLILVGTVFMSGPAGLLANLGILGIKSVTLWSAIVLVYYFIATILPVDKVIGKLYPIFGLSLLIMALGIGSKLLFSPEYTLPAFTMKNMHPDGVPVWAVMFTTIACGAISGFHATQSPMMARCMTNEKEGRPVFYGAMIAEGIIAMIWAAAGMAFYKGIPGLNNALAAIKPAGVVNEISITMLGKVGGLLAMLGVIAAPITSGDTAFRSARLTIADAAGYDQTPIKNRLILSAPLFLIAIILTQVDFQIVWRYFTWANQTLAMITLWAATAYLMNKGKSHLMTTIPAIFMTAVSATYLLQAKEGFHLATKIAYPLGLVITVVLSIVFLKLSKKRSTLDLD